MLLYAGWCLGCQAPQLPWTSYYDDYVVVAASRHTPSFDGAVSSFLKLLGWAFATKGSKVNYFGSHVDALGITIDLLESQSGLLKFANTERLKEELAAKAIDDISCSNHLSSSRALRLRCRI